MLERTAQSPLGKEARVSPENLVGTQGSVSIANALALGSQTQSPLLLLLRSSHLVTRDGILQAVSARSALSPKSLNWGLGPFSTSLHLPKRIMGLSSHLLNSVECLSRPAGWGSAEAGWLPLCSPPPPCLRSPQFSPLSHSLGNPTYPSRGESSVQAQ